MYFKIKTAGLVIGITCQYDKLYAYCREYVVTDLTTDFEVIITLQDILREKNMAFGKSAVSNLSDTSSRNTDEEGNGDIDKSITGSRVNTFEDFEITAALRKIAEILPEYHCFLMHGVVVSWRGEGYMFTAPSGTGKSTHAALWKKYLGDDVEIINGDKPFIRMDNAGVYAFGTPWAGKEKWQKNTGVPLKGICFLQQGHTNCIQQLQPHEAMPLLLKQVYCTGQAATAEKTLEMLNAVFENVPMYGLTCDMSEEAVRCSWEGMTKKGAKKGASHH